MYQYDPIDQQLVELRVAQFRDPTRRFCSLANAASIGRIVGPAFARDEIADVVGQLLATYVEARESDAERFVDVVHRIGIEPFREAVYAHAD